MNCTASLSNIFYVVKNIVSSSNIIFYTNVIDDSYVCFRGKQ